MAFTYDLTTDRGKVRLRLGDSVENKGPRPRKNNFSDAEIDYLLSSQGSSVNKAVASGLDLLADEWLSYSIQEREENLAYDAKGLSDKFAERARDWWSKPEDGSSSNSLQAGVILLDFAEKGDYPAT